MTSPDCDFGLALVNCPRSATYNYELHRYLCARHAPMATLMRDKPELFESTPIPADAA